MVGYGVQTAKGGKNGEAISLFLRQNTEKFGRFSRFSDISVKGISIWINLCFYIKSLTSKTENEQGIQLKHFYQILFMRVAL